MKKNPMRLVLILILGALLLTACSGGTQANSWSGVMATDDMVYYSSGMLVYALRGDNGNIVWQYPEKGSAQRMFYAEPVLAGEQLIVGDYAHKLTSLNAKTGVEIWQFTEAKGRYIDSPLVVNDLILAPNGDYTLYAVDLSGNLAWSFKAGHALWARPVSDGKNVYFSSMDQNLYAVSITDGSLVWKTPLQSSAVARGLLVDGTLYLGTLTGDLFSINTVDGSVNWTQKLGGGIWAAPVPHEGMLYLGDQSGRISILNSEDGKVVSTIETESAILGTGVELEGGLAFGNEAGELVVIGFDGERQWMRSFDGNLYANIQKSGDHLLLSLTKGEIPLMAIDQNGNEVWKFSEKQK
jgi:outer membrane protein assembly factor BamB